MRHGSSPDDFGIAPSVSSAWRTLDASRSSPAPEAKPRFLSRRSGTNRLVGRSLMVASSRHGHGPPGSPPDRRNTRLPRIAANRALECDQCHALEPPSVPEQDQKAAQSRGLCICITGRAERPETELDLAPVRTILRKRPHRYNSMMRAIAPMTGNATTSGRCEDGTRSVATMAFIGTDDSLLDGHRQAVDVFVERNGCSTQTRTVEPSWRDDLSANYLPCTCVEYQGCKAGYPVISCEYIGGHRFAPDTGPALWDLFSQS